MVTKRPRMPFSPVIEISVYAEILKHFHGLEKVGQPTEAILADDGWYYISWGDIPRRVTYRVNSHGDGYWPPSGWQCDGLILGFTHWFADCREPSITEVCNLLRRRGVKMTRLDGALSLVGSGGELEVCDV